MRYLLIFSIFLIGCSKEEDVVFNNPYQLLTAWKGKGYGQGTILWTKQIDLNYKIFYDIIPDYRNSDTNFQTFDVDITKLADTIRHCAENRRLGKIFGKFRPHHKTLLKSRFPDKILDNSIFLI